MQGMNQKNQNGQQVSQRQLLESKYGGSRHNLLLVVVFTLINIVLLVTNSNTYFLFSAYLPYLAADLGMLMCGLYPAEVYGGSTAGMEFLGKGFLAAMLGFGAVILILYLLSWIFSKKRVGWLIFALVFFSIDTAVLLLLNGISSDIIVDIVFHGWVIFSLGNGIASYYKLKKLPEEEQLPEQTVEAEIPQEQ